jgi:hypothetical protein
MAITLDHRWLMRSWSHKWNGIDALFKSTSPQFVWKLDLNLPKICFRLSIWPNGHCESQKYEFGRGLGSTNEAAGLIFCPLIQLKTTLGFPARRLFGPGSTEEVARSWYSRRRSCLDRIPCIVHTFNAVSLRMAKLGSPPKQIRGKWYNRHKFSR